MRLTVLGCAGTFPQAHSACSGYLVEHDGYRLVVDLGHGALSGLDRLGGLKNVDAVLVSHLHADHCIDLIGFSYARRFHPEGPLAPLPVYGPRGLQDRIVRSFNQPPRDSLDQVYDFHTTSAGGLELGPLSIELHETAHPIECHAMRITAGGRTLTYSADTAASDNVVKAARNADLFLCEASWLHGPKRPANVHMTAVEAGEHATRADAARLLLTHT
ncbi:MAG: MBL fold metallo-hydrolase, partial [Frankia sp.]|nr:MBL fold metallo-hydrolase [Frankia sp.]